MLKKYFINCLSLFFILIFLFTGICHATAVTVTDKNLSEAFQKYVSSNANEENYKISVSNNAIDITVDNERYTLNYDLTDEPTFSLEVPIQKGMSYDDFKKKTDNLILSSLGYVAVANIQGVEMEDASTYFLLSYLSNALNGSFSSENSYVIVDDLNLSDGVTIEKTDDSKTIYTSEFGDRVIEYVNAIYPETQTISDSEEINSFVMTIEKKDITETSCKLVSTLSVNLDADFSKIEKVNEGIKDSFVNNDITKDNADYVIALKVGQKCKIETNEKITGYELYGGYVEIDEETTKITAIKAGEANGYFYIGDEKKSFYITVEENTGNETLDEIILKLDSTSNVNNLPNNTGEETQGTINNVEGNNKLPNDSTIPYSGIENNLIVNLLYALIVIALFTIATLFILNKYRRKNK